MSHLINMLEKIGSNTLLKAATLKNPSNKLHYLGISRSLTNVLINKDRHKLTKLTKSRANMCCFIMRPPTALEVFNKPLNGLTIKSSNNYIPCRKLIA